MADLSIVAGATSQSILVDLYVLATGAPQTGLAFNSSGLLANYSFVGTNAAATAITLATLAAVNSAYSSGGFKEIDVTNMPGLYRLDLPNAVLAAAKGREVVVTLTGFSGMATRHKIIELTGWDNQDAVRGGLSALPNAAAGAASGLIINGTNAGTVTLAALTITGATTHTGATIHTANVSMAAGLNITQSTSNASALVVTGNGTGHGVVLTSGSGATGDGLQATAASTNGNGVTLTHAGTGKDFNATSTPLTLAKGTNLTGLNDIAATAIVSSGAITTSSGAVSTVTTTATATNLTNAPTAGDFTAAMKTSLNAATPASIVGAVGSVTGSVGSVVGLTASNLDTTISSRMASYTQPTGFLAATFPTGTIASTTNITGGTITTATNLTNAATAGDLTAVMKASVTTAATAATPTAAAVTGNVGGNVTGSVGSLATQAKTDVENAVWNTVLASHLTAGTTGNALNAAGSSGDPWATALPGAYGSGSAGFILGTNLNAAITSRQATVAFPTNFAALGIGTGGHITNVDTLTTYTGNTPQTGDSFARLGVAGVGLTNLGDTRIANLDASVSSRSTYAGGAVASVTGSVGSVAGLTAANLDVAVSSRLASSGYTAPDNASIDATLAEATAIKAKTDSLTFTVSGQVDANVHYVNDAEVGGNGQSGTEWGPA